MVLYSFFFFFQAEDGIRDLTVTGVQTCVFRSKGGRLDHVDAVRRILDAAGVCVSDADGMIAVKRHNGRLVGVDVMTEPYPGFPTDLQAQIMTLMARSEEHTSELQSQSNLVCRL